MANNLNNTTNAQFIPTIIAQKALGKFGAYMNLAKTVARDFDFTPAKEGQTIYIPKRGTLSANAKAVGTDVTKQNPTATATSVVLDQHYEVTISIEDITSVLQNQNTLDGYAEDAAVVLAEKIETAIANLHTSITNTVTFDTTSATTQENSFLTARQRLILNNVPAMERRYAYLHPTVITKLLQIDRFTRADAYGKNGVIAEGALGRIGGFDVFESQLVAQTGSPVAYHNLMYTRNAIILASRPLPVAPGGMGVSQQVINDPNINLGLRVTSSYNPDQLAMQITLDVLYGVALLDTRCIVEFDSF
jgi:N4-gp56 family major capsid protein